MFEILTQSSVLGPGVPPNDLLWVETDSCEKYVDGVCGEDVEVGVGWKFGMDVFVDENVVVIGVVVYSILLVGWVGVINLNLWDHHL